MRRKHKAATTLAAMVGLTSLALGGGVGCSVPLCEERPGDPRCMADGGTTADLAVLSTRLSKNGGRVNVTAKGATNVKLVLPGNLEVGCTVDGSGSGSCDVSMTQLAAVTPGQISVTLKAGDKSLSAKLRVFQPPTFMDATGMKATYSTGARQPTWVQVAKGHVFMSEDSATNRQINEYMISGTTIQSLPDREPFVNTVPLSTVLDVSEGQVVRAGLSGAMFALENADLAATTDVYTSFKMVNLTKVNALSVNRDSTVMAVAGEGADAPLKAFTVPTPGQTNSAAVILNGGSQKAVMRVGVGKLTDMSTVDIVAAHSDGASVFLQKTGMASPSLDQALSSAVGSKLIGPGLTAMALGDIDRDGLDDVIAAQGTSIIVLSIDGTTVTSTPVLSSLPAAVDAIAVGDVSGDGKPDLVIAQKTGAMLTVFLNQVQ
ncbi:MAG: VCBS repeat-containing protein [Myxococcales bacterium]|nr:VCBS repeat-containing protein [Myxococcales bacterium]